MQSEKEEAKNELKTKKKVFVEILRTLRAPIFNIFSTKSFYSMYFEETNLKGIPYFMPFVILPTRHCSWLRKSGGCFECGYSNLSNKNIKDEQILNLFDSSMEFIKNIPHQMVAIGTSGSFLDNQELSKYAQNEILKKISSLPNIKTIGIESRPEFVTPEKIKEICEIAHPKKIMLGMGLESSNDLIREFCINKGLTTRDFIQAKDIIKDYKNVSALAYILLGKPFLPKIIDIIDSINSINFAANAGFDRIVLMATSLRQSTLAKFLYEIGEYNPPQSRMIIEVLKRLNPKIRSKLILANPRLPKPEIVNQCPECSELLEQLIIACKLTNNYDYIILADKLRLSCKCIQEYENISEFGEVLSIERLILNSYTRALRKIKGGKNECNFSRSRGILR